MIQFLRSVRWQLAHCHQCLHILARSTNLTAQEEELLQVSSFKSQVSLHWITDPGESRFPLLVKILAEQGLDESWAREQLFTGSCAILATARSEEHTSELQSRG